MSQGQKLRPCPFCGGEAEIERMGNRDESCLVVCTNCGCQHEGPDRDEQSGSLWNIRIEEDAARASFASIDETIRTMSGPLVEWLNRDGTPTDVRQAFRACVYAVAIRAQAFASGAKGDLLARSGTWTRCRCGGTFRAPKRTGMSVPEHTCPGCRRAERAEDQRDALLAVAKLYRATWPASDPDDDPITKAARAAIAKAREGATD